MRRFPVICEHCKAELWYNRFRKKWHSDLDDRRSEKDKRKFPECYKVWGDIAHSPLTNTQRIDYFFPLGGRRSVDTVEGQGI